MFYIDQVGKRLTVTQLTFILVFLIVCIVIIGPYKLAEDDNVLVGSVNTAINPTRPLEECPFIPKDYDTVWKWCHGSRYKVCKANFPYQNKTEDLTLILDRITKIFDRHRIKWWIDFSSLQGAVANDGILPWDYQVQVSVIEKRFRQYYPQVMEELHQCADPLSPLYYKRYSTSDSNLKGKFITKWEPRFWVEIITWDHNEKENMLRRAGWTVQESEKEQLYSELSYSLIAPLGKAEYSGLAVNVPSKTYQVLQSRFGDDWDKNEPPNYYKPNLKWGSEEMKALKP